MKNIILYHAGCCDGFAAAFAAWLKFGDEAQYIPVQYGEPVPDIQELTTRMEGETRVWDSGPHEVYIVDFSYRKDLLLALGDRGDVAKVVVLDHHKTASAELDGLPEIGSGMIVEVRFDMSKSGAVLAWEYFHPNKPVPEMFLYVQDRDLWEWRLPGSRSVNEGLWRGHQRHFGLWHHLLENWGSEFDDIMHRGWGITQSDEYMLRALSYQPEHIFGPGGELGLSVNSPVLQSELGEKLLADHPLALFADIWNERGGKRIHSLRSRKEGASCDVSAIAAARGGGGHRCAAGYTELALT